MVMRGSPLNFTYFTVLRYEKLPDSLMCRVNSVAAERSLRLSKNVTPEAYYQEEAVLPTHMERMNVGLDHMPTPGNTSIRKAELLRRF